MVENVYFEFRILVYNMEYRKYLYVVGPYKSFRELSQEFRGLIGNAGSLKYKDLDFWKYKVQKRKISYSAWEENYIDTADI